MKVKLTKPLTVKGKEVKELDLNFDSLTGNDLVAAEREARAMGDNTPVIALSMQYQAAVAARLIGCPVDDVLALPAKDFKNIVGQASSFLFV